MSRLFFYIVIPAFCFVTASCQPKQETVPAPSFKTYRWDEFAMGADLSYVNQAEDYGAVYKDSGIAKDPFRLFSQHGCNVVRVRLWHNPQWVASLNGGKKYYDLAGIEKTIRRAKEAGMAVNLDLHYSDTWTDPGKQQLPAAWSGLTLPVLIDSVYQYTSAVLHYLQSKDLVPELIQIGNETNSGMLWPTGKITGGDFSAFARLLNSGIKAVRDFSAGAVIKPKIILHVAQFENADHWVKGITSNSVTDFDIIGVSHYTKWTAVKTMTAVTDSVQQLRQRFHKTVMIVETAYPWTGDNADSYTNIFSAADAAPGYGISREEQLRYLKELTQAVINGGGKGVMYWEPAWISSGLNDGWGTGSSWENNTFFDFSGHCLPGIDFMRQVYK